MSTATPLPAAIQRQAEQVAAIEASLAAANPVDKAPPLGVVVPNPATLESGTVVSASQQVVAPARAEEAPPAETPQAPPENWEHKYKTIQGMYNSHVPKLQQQLKDLKRELDEIRAQATQPAEPSPPEVNKKDVEEFGADLVEMVMRNAESVFGPVISRMDSRITALEQKLTVTSQVASQSAEAAFFSELVKLVPDWEAINADERFLAWLAEVDPIYGQPRQAAMDAASHASDARRVANVFLAWKSLAAPKPNTQQPSLEAQVAPRAAASAPVQTAVPPAQVITQKQIQDFYNDVTKGRYRGREQEQAAIEAAINQAVAEGRVR